MSSDALFLLQIVGAVGVALAVEHDRHGAFTFIVPALLGIIVLIGSWVRIMFIAAGLVTKSLLSSC